MPRFRHLSVLVLAVVAVCCSSCGKADNRKPTFVVSGKVLDGTKPLANVAVVFHPVGEDGPKPRGKTDAEGAFSLTTYDTADGAPAGEYRVTLELWLAGRPDEGPSNRLPAKLAKPESSGFQTTISTSPNDLTPFNVRSK